MRLLVTGTKGQVATALKARAASDLDIIQLGRPEFDLAAPKNLTGMLRRIAPDIIVNAAAYTAVDRAETEPELAFAINAAGAGAIAQSAQDIGVPLIQISTDYVFDGAASRPLLEIDPTGPIGVYGASKLAGEVAVMAAASDHVILRTAWVYAPFGANFVRTMLRLATTRAEIRVVADQFGTPTSALDIAAAIEAVARNLVARPNDISLRGIFHIAATGGAISWAEFAAEIFRLSVQLDGPSAQVVPITSAEYPTPAKRPAYSCLNTAKLAQVHGVALPDWRDGLARVIAQLHKEGRLA